jgi:hypothetical protein
LRQGIHLFLVALVGGTVAFGAIQGVAGNSDIAIGSSWLALGLYAVMTACTAMPPPSLLDEKGLGRYLLTWAYNVAQIFAQNFSRLHLTEPEKPKEAKQ